MTKPLNPEALRDLADRMEKSEAPSQEKGTVREFSKVMIKTYSLACIIWITASYVLSAFDKQVNEGVTIAVVSSLAAVLLAILSRPARKTSIKIPIRTEDNYGFNAFASSNRFGPDSGVGLDFPQVRNPIYQE